MDSPTLFPSSVVRGSESHKMIDLSGNPVLRIYYTSRVSISYLIQLVPILGLHPGPRLGEGASPEGQPVREERPISRGMREGKKKREDLYELLSAASGQDPRCM